MNKPLTTEELEAPAVPAGFGLESEHPMLSMPFFIKVGNQRIEGRRISVTEVEVAVPKGSIEPGKKGLATLSFPFEDFALSLTAQITATERGDGETTVLLFSEPTGAHLAQLRYIINSYIAGDLVTLNGLMSYSGPTQPKAPKPQVEKDKRDRVRSLSVALVSLLIAFLAGTIVFARYTTSFEMHPVFIDRAGMNMQATVAGQVTYLNADAPVGEVAYTIASTTGDVLSFQMPQEGEVTLASEIFEGATVLPTDLILTIFDDTSEVRLRTMISIEGLARALQGDPVTMDISDGRSLPVEVDVRDTTRAAALRGDLYVPVDLVVKGDPLEPSAVTKSARLRLSKTLLGAFGLGQEK
jgi:hypothetical protein